MNRRHLIQTYHHAWTTGDFVTARACLADDLDFKGSVDTFGTADAFLAALTMFHGMLRRVTLLQAFFDADGGALLYDCDTPTPAGSFAPPSSSRSEPARSARSAWSSTPKGRASLMPPK